MERRGGCCIAARYATGGTYQMSKVDRILLKFRPIAPKPGTTTSDGSSPERSAAGTFSKSGRSRRKHAKDVNSGSKRRRSTCTVPPPAVTLPLLPETPDRKDPPVETSKNDELVWLNFEQNQVHAIPTDPAAAVVFGGSVVTVECVTDTWQGGSEWEWLLGRGEEEVKEKLGEDTCPGFISDGYGRVTWTNGVFREMVGEGGVWLVMKMTVPYSYNSGFTCWVRVQYACGKERTVVPCDAWRMGSGGFAWRLDVKAALSLSLAL